jgi:hypothetical protein
MRCSAYGKPMRGAWLTVAGRSYGPRCGRPMLAVKPRARRRDAGRSRGPRSDPRQLPLLDEAAL